MDLIVIEELKSNYVNLKCSGKYDSTSSLFKILKQGFDVASKNGLIGILVDVSNVRGFPLTTMDRFRLGEYVSTLNLEYIGKTGMIKMAVVGNESLIHKDKFGVTVGTNRGANLRGFNDIDEAKSWLN